MSKQDTFWKFGWKVVHGDKFPKFVGPRFSFHQILKIVPKGYLSQTVIWPRQKLMKYLLFPPQPSVFSRQSRHPRSLVRRASAARAILLANAASLYFSQQAAQAVPSQFVAKSGERDGSGASSRPVLSQNLPRSFPPHRKIRPQNARLYGKSNSRLTV